MTILRTADLDRLTSKYTAFDSFMKLTQACYTPTLRTETAKGKEKNEITALAYYYDRFMEINDSRKRVFRA